VAFSTKIYCKFTAACACLGILRSINISLVTGKKADCLTCSVFLGTVLLKDEELTRYLEYGKKELLLALVRLTLT